MDREIIVGENTKPAHGRFVAWLNSLLQNYEIGPWDDAIKNIIMLSFIRKHTCFMQELYSENGQVFLGFLTILPTDTTNPLILIHEGQSGIPIFYNDQNSAEAFEFNDQGVIVRFFENVTIPLTSVFPEFTVNAELFISFEERFGIKAPMVIVKSSLPQEYPDLKGWLDIPYDGKYSSSYLVVNQPLSDNPTYTITNTSKVQVIIDLPILPKLNVKYTIPAGQSILVPITELTSSFGRKSRAMGNITVTKTPTNI